MPRVLTRQQVENYRENGFVAPLRILADEEVAACRRELEATEAMLGGRLKPPNNTKFYLRFPWAYRLATDPRILDAVEDLIGPDILLYHNMAWLKGPREGTYVSWHQDNTYFGHDPCEVLTVWVALSPATKETGCVQVLPGTHRLGQLPLTVPDINGGNMLASGMTVDFDVASVQPVAMELRPGEISIHHAFLIHSSTPNQGGDRRLGVTFIYHPPHLRQLGACRTSAMLVRGEDRYGNFDREIPPVAADDPRTIANHLRFVEQYRAKTRELGNATVARFD